MLLSAATSASVRFSGALTPGTHLLHQAADWIPISVCRVNRCAVASSSLLLPLRGVPGWEESRPRRSMLSLDASAGRHFIRSALEYDDIVMMFPQDCVVTVMQWKFKDSLSAVPTFLLP
ncbi:hypothetical protein NDU88_007094 [Pleurodeles waltl]|uniref:Uncharacterized protein n=1 Tax=Pleurodeles waltl TaxID=8319 RepID=A0AAV7N3C1_PLEWA|nr:hypothetical protein NDU88_007094 [Pleurodeles waltl]